MGGTLLESAARRWHAALAKIRGLRRLAPAALTAVAGVALVVAPVVSPGSFDAMKTCSTRVLCAKVWIAADGFNYALLLFFASAGILIVAEIRRAASAPQHKPVTAWTAYAHDVAILVAGALGSPGIDALDEGGYRARAQRLLETMAGVARSLSGDAAGNVKVEASLMVAVYPPPSDLPETSVHFLHRGRSLSTYSGVLIVDAYSSSLVPLPYLRLPIDKGQHLLPGAPTACERGVVCIDDTLALTWADHKGIDQELQATVEKYFHEQRATLRTMICIPIKGPQKVLGVVNIHSSTPNLFRDSAELVNQVLEPYIAIMLALLDHRHAKAYSFVQAPQ
jgi:hypothetical protein